MKRTLLFAALMSVASASYGTTVGFGTTVIRTLSDVTLYGGCMAKLSDQLETLGLNCPSAWVAFSCTGEFAAKDLAKQNFELTQMAFLTDARVFVAVDDTKKHNGFCFARRVDLY